MPSPERFEVVAPLPSHGEWRRAVAVERAGAPRALVLAFAPPSLVDDADRLAAVLRDAEAAGRLRHPGAAPVLGTETVGDALAVVEEYRSARTLREILDAGGRLPPDIAARLALDACAALEAAHAIDVGAGRVLSHGAIDPGRILVGDEGAGILCGFGTSGGGEPAADVRAVAAVLHECLAGEPPGRPARPIDAPGIPPALAAAVDRALGAGEGEPFPTAGELARAVAGAGPVASHRGSAAYAEAILPAGEGLRAAMRAAVARALHPGGVEDVSAELIVEPTDPSMLAARVLGTSESAPLPRPPSTRPGADPAGVFRAPAAIRRPSRLPLVVLVCAGSGFVVGLAGARLVLSRGAAGPIAAEERAATATPGRAPEAAPPAAAPLAARPSKVPAARSSRPVPGVGFLDVTAPSDAEVLLDGRRIGRGSVRLEIREGTHRIEVRHGPNRVEERFTLAAGETWTYAVTPAP